MIIWTIHIHIGTPKIDAGVYYKAFDIISAWFYYDYFFLIFNIAPNIIYPIIMQHALIIIVVILIVWLIAFGSPHEYFTGDLRFASIPSSRPVPYDQYPITYGDGYHIRRWRTAIPPDKPVYVGAPNWSISDAGLAKKIKPQLVVPRSIQDDTWARAYDPGIGFQLG